MTITKFDGRNYIFQVDGVNPSFVSRCLGQQLDDLRKIGEFKATARKYHVYAKGKATLAAVKKWVREFKPKQFYACWGVDSPNYKDDSVEVFFTT